MATKTLLLSLLASAVSSQSLKYDIYGTNRSAPYRRTPGEFSKIFDPAADAEGVYSVIGPDISADYLDITKAENATWKWSISTKADVPLDRGNQTFTATQITLELPDGKTIHESWQVCVLEWHVDPNKFPESMRGDDGTCSSTLSKECVRDVEAEVLKQYQVDHGMTACTCPRISAIRSCEDDRAKQAFNSGGACQARTFNATQLRQWPDGKLTVIQYGGPEGERGNRTDYDHFGGISWPVLVMWGNSGNQTRGTSLVDFKNEAKLSCIRAVNGTETSGNAGSRNLPRVGMFEMCATLFATVILF